MNIKIGNEFRNNILGVNHIVTGIQFVAERPEQLSTYLIEMQSDGKMRYVFSMDYLELALSKGYLTNISNRGKEKPVEQDVWLPSTRYEIEGVSNKAKVDFHDDISIPDFLLKKTCECGKDKHDFASHSTWCPIKE